MFFIAIHSAQTSFTMKTTTRIVSIPETNIETSMAIILFYRCGHAAIP